MYLYLPRWSKRPSGREGRTCLVAEGSGIICGMSNTFGDHTPAFNEKSNADKRVEMLNDCLRGLPAGHTIEDENKCAADAAAAYPEE